MTVVPAPHVRRAELHYDIKLREMAGRSLAYFLRYRFHREKRPLVFNWHLGMMCEVQTAVWKRQERFVLYNVPFRSLKTETIEQTWQAFMILQDDTPASSVLSVGADATLAEESSEKTRDMVGSEWFADLAKMLGKDIGLDKAHAKKNDWRTAGGCERKSIGVDGTVVGKGADHLLWGDILKPTEANSDLVRTKTCNWLGETFRSRMNDQKTGTLTGIMQRLHELDPTGYLLEQMKTPGADQYLLIKVPMECPKPKVYSYGDFFYRRKADELMHPDRVGPKEIAALKVSLGVNYSGQCNQEPTKMQGNTLQLAWLNWYRGAPPKITRVYQSWDVAVTEDDQAQGCYSVCNTWGRTAGNQFYLLDVFRAKIGSVQLVEAFIEQAEKHKPAAVIGTKNVIEKTVLPFLKLRLREIGLNLRFILIAERGGSKLERGQPFLDACRNGNVYVPEHERWVPDWKLEMCAVPNGAYWDQWDSAAIFFQALDEIKAGEIVDEKPQEDNQDHSAIRADKLRKAVGKGAIPNAKAKAVPAVDAIGLLRAGKRVPVTADDYVHRVRRLMEEHLLASKEAGDTKQELITRGELERLDRRYREALEADSPET